MPPKPKTFTEAMQKAMTTTAVEHENLFGSATRGTRYKLQAPFVSQAMLKKSQGNLNAIVTTNEPDLIDEIESENLCKLYCSFHKVSTHSNGQCRAQMQNQVKSTGKKGAKADESKKGKSRPSKSLSKKSVKSVTVESSDSEEEADPIEEVEDVTVQTIQGLSICTMGKPSKLTDKDVPRPTSRERPERITRSQSTGSGSNGRNRSLAPLPGSTNRG